MQEATLRQRVTDLLSASGRSDVPPFMVMDVMSAAERIEAVGGHVIHMEVGQPHEPAPKTALAAARPRTGWDMPLASCFAREPGEEPGRSTIVRAEDATATVRASAVSGVAGRQHGFHGLVPRIERVLPAFQRCP